MGDHRLRLPLRDWSFLPDDVIHLIVSRMKSVEDLMSISSVCRSWRSVTVKDYPTKRVQFPWLLIFPRNIFENKGFFSLDKYKYFNINFQNPQDSRYWGSKLGLIIILSFNRQFHLFNPVTKTRLDLPPKPIFRDEIDHDDRESKGNAIPGFVRKALVFKDDDDKYVLVAIGSVSGNLSFARPGDDCWVHVKAPFGRVLSAVWCKGRLFFMLGSGALMCCEKNENGVYIVREFISEMENVGIWDNIGLVEISGVIFMVVRYYCDKEWYKTSCFVVYQMDFENKVWVGTKDLGDCALFVDADDNVSALKASEVYNCQNNCIYFVEKHWDRHGRYSGSHDVGNFYLKDSTVEPLFISNPGTSSPVEQNPIWVMPSLS